MWGLRPFGALLKRYTGKIFLKSRFGHPTAKVGLAYKTVISLIEGIERGDGLKLPDTVHCWRKNDPLPGLEPPNTVLEKEE